MNLPFNLVKFVFGITWILSSFAIFPAFIYAQTNQSKPNNQSGSNRQTKPTKKTRQKNGLAVEHQPVKNLPDRVDHAKLLQNN
ncbi:MAG: hypothetical protein HC907_31705 [Richelia sp. SM1_7_0]|nr:hypothetical protein [Richelia sp. SM1_7_0]